MWFTVWVLHCSGLLTYHINTDDYIEFKALLLESKKRNNIEPPKQLLLIRKEGKWWSEHKDTKLINMLAEEIEHYFRYQL